MGISKDLHFSIVIPIKKKIVEGEKGVEFSIKSLLSPRMSVLALRDERTQSEKDKFKKREKEKSQHLNLSMCPARFA